MNRLRNGEELETTNIDTLGIFCRREQRHRTAADGKSGLK